MNIIFQKILNLFRKYKNPCFYIHINFVYGKIMPDLYNVKDIKRIFFNPKLNKSEYSPKNQISEPIIWSVYQGKRLFYRFLKENDFFTQYLYYHAILKLDVNTTIRKEFVNPFYSIMHEIVTRGENKSIKKFVLKDLRKMESLSKKWHNILKSVYYRV